ncbi:MAG: helix-turn-helix transcriptional regulator [Myxococcales bacterium]|nr:helix-turn-helix transcriptional regulator [Myxococcales bacterium]
MRQLDDARVIQALKALADPNRFRMVQVIAEAGEISCGEVNEQFDLAQPTISHHVRLLVDAGLLTARTEGKHHMLSVDRALLTRLAGVLPARLAPERRLRGRAVARRA